jgi:hypothetical protein
MKKKIMFWGQNAFFKTLGCKYIIILNLIIGVGFLHLADPARAEDQAELAKKLANPISSLISVPIQVNYDQNMAQNQEGSQWKINIQPVIPFSMSENWNINTRTIVPLIDQDDIPVPGQGESGLGDITASQFFSPKALTAGGWTWGAGPVWLLPTATEDSLGTGKWGIGPTAVALKQSGPWTYGALFNHIWSFAGDDDRADVNSTFLQPFVAYVTKTHTTFSMNTESTYDWESEEWSVPINFMVKQMLKIGRQPVQIAAGVRYWVDSPEGSPEDWGARLEFTFLFPK